MLLYSLPALWVPFPRIFIIKGNADHGKNPPFCPFPVILFINEEATGCINEGAIGARGANNEEAYVVSNPPSYFFMFYCLSSIVNKFVN